MEKSFAFIGSIIKPKGFNEIEIIKGYILKRANEEQVAYIEKVLNRIDSTDIEANRFSNIMYKSKREPLDKGVVYMPLENKYGHNYWIIEYKGIQMEEELLDAIRIATKDFNILFQILNIKSNPTLSNEFRIFNFIKDYAHKNINIKVNIDDIKEISNNYKKIKILKESKVRNELYRDLFNVLGVYENQRNLKIKGIILIPIIENILVNYDEDRDIKTSEQFASKLYIVNKQLAKYGKKIQGPLKSDTKFLKLMKILYQYRCDFAHGESINNKKIKNIHELGKSIEEKNDFIRLIYIRLIFLIVQDYNFIRDLKKIKNRDELSRIL